MILRCSIGIEREGGIVGRGVARVEGIHKFFHPHGVIGRQLAIVNVTPGNRVRSSIDIQGEGRKVIARGIYGRVDAVILEGVALRRSSPQSACTAGIGCTSAAAVG
jgi:hypothetical protein